MRAAGLIFMFVGVAGGLYAARASVEWAIEPGDAVWILPAVAAAAITAGSLVVAGAIFFCGGMLADSLDRRSRSKP